MTAQDCTAEEALDTLLMGNRRHVHGQPTHVQTISDRATLATTHTPIAAIVCCADARTTPEIIFDQAQGSLFTCAVAGNVVTDAVLGSLTYAATALQVPVIVILGHSCCGAVTAAVQGVTLPEPLAGLVAGICTGGHDDVDAAVAANVQAMVATVQAALDVPVIGAVHELATGTVTVV